MIKSASNSYPSIVITLAKIVKFCILVTIKKLTLEVKLNMVHCWNRKYLPEGWQNCMA